LRMSGSGAGLYWAMIKKRLEKIMPQHSYARS
jgi:hypothetical protein